MGKLHTLLDSALTAFEDKDADALSNLSIDVLGETEYVAGLSDADSQIMNQIETQTRLMLGEQVAYLRLSLEREDAFDGQKYFDKILELLGQLSPPGKSVVRPAVEKVAENASKEPIPVDEPTPYKAVENEAIESFFARELVDLLPSLVPEVVASGYAGN